MKFYGKKAVIQGINSIIDALFDRFIDDVLGFGKDSVRSNISEKSLPALFMRASVLEGVKPDFNMLKGLLTVTKYHINAKRESLKAKILSFISAKLNSGEKIDVSAIKTEIEDIFKKTEQEIQTVVSTESNSVKNMAVLDGIVSAAKDHNIDDPSIAFLGPLDSITCKVCIKLFWLPGSSIPKVYKLSEINYDYYKKGDEMPSIHGGHPNCRHTPTLILPGYGFNKSGTLVFVEEAHDEYLHQRESE